MYRIDTQAGVGVAKGVEVNHGEVEDESNLNVRTRVKLIIGSS